MGPVKGQKHHLTPVFIGWVADCIFQLLHTKSCILLANHLQHTEQRKLVAQIQKREFCGQFYFS